MLFFDRFVVMSAIKIYHLPQFKIEDYRRWKGDWELIRGIPDDVSPSANKLHQDVARNTLRMFMNSLESNSSCCKLYYELDFILATDTVVRPDLIIFCEEIEFIALTFSTNPTGDSLFLAG
ncbi:MAG: Uma2 family endonuclease [Saprospiraceae bacterium]|nr:Uma2 family endonuclease [Saprospiraceae bacterium]